MVHKDARTRLEATDIQRRNGPTSWGFDFVSSL